MPRRSKFSRMWLPLWSGGGDVKKWGMRGYVKECGADTIIDCREWQREQWENERAQRDLEERRRKSQQSFEERRDWCRRRTCRRRMRRRSRRPSPPPALERVEPECGVEAEAPGPRPRDMLDPTSERPSAMKRRARRLLREASAYASTLGDAQREEKERLLQEAQRLLDERERMQKDLARAVTHPATHHTAAASGAQEGEPLEAFPRALRRTLLELGVEQTLADQLIRVEGEKGQKGQKAKGTKGKGTGNKGGGKKGGGKKGKGKW